MPKFAALVPAVILAADRFTLASADARLGAKPATPYPVDSCAVRVMCANEEWSVRSASFRGEGSVREPPQLLNPSGGAQESKNPPNPKPAHQCWCFRAYKRQPHL